MDCRLAICGFFFLGCKRLSLLFVKENTMLVLVTVVCWLFVCGSDKLWVCSLWRWENVLLVCGGSEIVDYLFVVMGRGFVVCGEKYMLTGNDG